MALYKKSREMGVDERTRQHKFDVYYVKLHL